MVATQVTTNVVGTRLHPQTAGTLGVPAVFIFLAAVRGVHGGRRSIDFRECALI
jgi:hypothetical protein